MSRNSSNYSHNYLDVRKFKVSNDWPDVVKGLLTQTHILLVCARGRVSGVEGSDVPADEGIMWCHRLKL